MHFYRYTLQSYSSVSTALYYYSVHVCTHFYSRSVVSADECTKIRNPTGEATSYEMQVDAILELGYIINTWSLEDYFAAYNDDYLDSLLSLLIISF